MSKTRFLSLLLSGLVTIALLAPAAATAADTTPPTVSITTPTPAQHFIRGQDVQPVYTCADEPGGSGVASCFGSVDVDTSRLGSGRYEVYATDAAGNRTERFVDYFVDRAGTDLTKPTQLSELRASVRNRILGATFRMSRYATIGTTLVKLGGGVVKGSRCVRPPRHPRRPAGKHCDLPLGPYGGAILGPRRHSMIVPGQLTPGPYRLTLSVEDEGSDASSVTAEVRVK